MGIMDNLEAIIREQPFFAGMDQASVETIAGCAANVGFSAGEAIFRTGEPADQFYLLRYGKVALEIPTPNRGPHLLQTVGEGEVLGWS